MATALKSHNVELGKLRDGYPALAAWIARDPDNETFVFRKFDKLAARNLLCLQSELIELEREIDEQDEQARLSGDAEERQRSRLSSRRWESFIENARDPARPEKKRLEKIIELRHKLKEYHKALLLQAQIANLRGPSNRVLSTFRDYVDGESVKVLGAGGGPIIHGKARHFLEDKVELVALRKAIEDDPLSKLLQDNWAFQKRAATDPFDRTTIYKSKYVVRTVAAIAMVIATLLLIGATVGLSLVSDTRARLGMIAVFTLLFALSMVLLTNAKKAEIYTATAAYAAVLVVFVSGDLGDSGNDRCFIQLADRLLTQIKCPS